MRPSKASAIAVSLLLLLLCIAWTRAVPDKLTVSGYVYNADGKTPMPNVIIRVYYSDSDSVSSDTCSPPVRGWPTGRYSS